MAQITGANACTDLLAITSNADLYVISVPDAALATVVSELKMTNAFVVHTSGTMPMEVLRKFEHFGVFYPLQTMTKEYELDFSEVPLLIEADSASYEERLAYLAKTLKSKFYHVNSEKRCQAHIAAVFACNFTNHMYHIASDILKQAELPFDLLLPLIRETARKIETDKPSNIQTGPAARNDVNVMQTHIDMLEDPVYKEIYQLVSKSISTQALKK
ncbi:MAG: hypothetical protein BWY70_01701 [Bacteroidetes bacterium ADurb.Bin408]|nr:MAG: hypothetical protein BWY70_01701 [Bacteroidetes bacterium ADurb.Bin408]